MTSRSRSEQGRFSIGQNPLAGRGYQYAVGYNSNSDLQRRNNEMAMYADSLYNNPWYWENVGTEPITISISTAGFYLSVQEGRARASGFKDLTDLRGNPIPRQPEN